MKYSQSLNTPHKLQAEWKKIVKMVSIEKIGSKAWIYRIALRQFINIEIIMHDTAVFFSFIRLAPSHSYRKKFRVYEMTFLTCRQCNRLQPLNTAAWMTMEKEISREAEKIEKKKITVNHSVNIACWIAWMYLKWINVAVYFVNRNVSLHKYKMEVT